MSEAAHAPARKKGGKMLLVIVAVLCIGGGAAVPMVANVPQIFGKGKKEEKKKDAPTAVVPFGDIVVNLSEERMQRYLRLKLAVLVDAEKEKEMTDLMTKKKALVKSKLISHLAGKTLKDVSGTVGVNRLQREVRERFDEALYPDGAESQIREVLLEEDVVQ